MLSQLSQCNAGLKPLLIDSDRSLNYEQLESLSSQLAEYLLSNNVRLLALYADNSSNWFVVDAACQLANVCIVPLPTFFSHTQLQHIFETTAIDAIISMDSGIFEVLLKDAVIDKKETPLPGFCLLKVQTDCSWNDIPEGTGKITFTSGSTGKPKGVCLSNLFWKMLPGYTPLCSPVARYLFPNWRKSALKVVLQLILTSSQQSLPR